MQRRRAWIAIAALAGLGACSPDEGAGSGALAFRDDTTAPPRPPGGWINNGLSDPDVGGIDPAHALDTPEGLHGAALVDPDRRATAEYLVECALPEGDAVTTVIDGETVEFAGALGLAPEWLDGPCDEDCQQWVSACLLARTNVSGNAVALWLRGEHPALAQSTNPAYPFYEASFFGNLFLGDEHAHMCPGTLVGPVLAQLDGRTCSNLVGGYCDFTTYLACGLLPKRCDFEGLLSPVASDCKTGTIPGGAPLRTITTYVADPLL